MDATSTKNVATLEDLQKVCNLLHARHSWAALFIKSVSCSTDSTNKELYTVVAFLAGVGEFSGQDRDPFLALYDAVDTRFRIRVSPSSVEIFSKCVDEVQAEIDARNGPKLPVCKTIEEHVFVLSGSCFRCGQTADEVFIKRAG